MIELILKAVLSYLLGSMVGSLVIGGLRGGPDIRNLGSGNAGATNALRTQGKVVAFWVLLVDLAKGWVATRGIGPAHLPDILAAPVALHIWAPAVCGIAVMLGHIYPVWYGFRGGKGVATLVGAVLGLVSWLLVPMIVTWFVVVVVWGYVSLASILAALSLVVVLSPDFVGPHKDLLTFAILATLLIVYTHRSNLVRIRAGTEPRARRLWQFGRHRNEP
jgi:acyl phosphate:glycerol-3-phosphate acyltransferase